MAPEIFEMQEYDAKADIWSVGCVFYEMLGMCSHDLNFHISVNTERILRKIAHKSE